MSEEGNKTGYLNSDFKFFHLKDMKRQEFDFHYHEFDKIVILLSGNVNYVIEGKSYILKPWDILLVNNHDIHKPVIDDSVPYERIIIWVEPSFTESYRHYCDITACFRQADKKRFNLVRVDDDIRENIKGLLKRLENCINSDEFGSELFATTLFVQFLIYLNRICQQNAYIEDEGSLRYDKRIEEILMYINDNLSEDLSNDAISERFFISKYYLMHRFKDETGFTLHNYVMQKRLLKSLTYMKAGMSITSAASKCGFNDYSVFSRSFKKMFGSTPSAIKDMDRENEFLKD